MKRFLSAVAFSNSRTFHTTTFQTVSLKELIKTKRLSQAVDQLEKSLPKVSSSQVSLVLGACANERNLQGGERIALKISNTFHMNNPYVINSLISLYGKCGNLSRARHLFQTLKEKDIVSYNLMISICSENGEIEEAKKLLSELASSNNLANDNTFGSALKVYARCGLFEEPLDELIQKLEKYGMKWNEKHVSQVIHALSECGQLQKSVQVLVYGEKFEKIVPLQSCYLTIAQKAIQLKANEVADTFESSIRSNGLIGNQRIAGSLLDLHFSCNMLSEATQFVLSEDPYPNLDVISYTTAINVLGKEDPHLALLIFERMLKINVKPNSITFLCLLNVLSEGSSLELCLSHFKMMNSFNISPNEKHYSCIIKAYCKNNQIQQALSCILTARKNGIPSTPTMYTIVATAAAQIAFKQISEMVFSHIPPALLQEQILSNAVINMFMKSSCTEIAENIFNQMPHRDSESFNTMIAGYGQNGLGSKAVSMFKQMLQDEVTPTNQTFVSVLTACSHSGLLSEAIDLLGEMKNHNLKPDVRHFNCLIDAFGRLGKFEEMEKLVEQINPDVITWMTYLGWCRTHNFLTGAEFAFNKIMEMDPMSAAAHVLMANIYAQLGDVTKRNQIREVMDKKGIKKIPGITEIFINGKVHRFKSEESHHPEIDEIYKYLDKLIEKIIENGYQPNTSYVTRAEDDEEVRKALLCKHSEKIAIAYALMKTPPGSEIRITKNLRVCGDCHNATKIISKVTNRRIVMRDAARFHYVENGKCSCGDVY